MGAVVVVLLAAVWASILLPGVLRDRRSSHGFGSVSDFERTMQLLATRPGAATTHQPGRHVMVLDRPDHVAGVRRPGVLRRRRQVLRGLGLAAFAAAAIAVSVGGWTWWLALAVSVAFAGYVALMAHVQRRAALRAKVRHLPRRPSLPAYDLRDARRHA